MVFSQSTIRPGLLVSLKTSIKGNVKYEAAVIESDHRIEGGKRRAKWETTRTVEDAKEHEAAVKAKSKCRALITSVCANSAFGLLCPNSSAADLDKAVAEARKIAEDFNKKSKLTVLKVYVIAGKVAQDDVEAIKAIKSEMRDLLETMKGGVQNMDVKSIRDAAARALSVSRMLEPVSQAGIKLVVDQARKAAREIVKAGENAALEVDQQTLNRIAEARTAFLDLDDTKVEAPVVAKARAVDLAPDDVPVVKKPRRKAQAALEL